MWKSVPAFLGTLILAVACSGPQGSGAPGVIVITNQTTESIVGVRYRPCGDEDAEWSDMPGALIPPGDHMSVPPPVPCMDLEAMGPNSYVLGRRSGVDATGTARWTIR